MLLLFPAYLHHWCCSGSCPGDPWPELPNLGTKGNHLEHRQEASVSQSPRVTPTQHLVLRTRSLQCSSHMKENCNNIT